MDLTSGKHCTVVHTDEYQVEEVSLLLLGQPLSDYDVERRVEGTLHDALHHSRRDEGADAGSGDQGSGDGEEGGEPGSEA